MRNMPEQAKIHNTITSELWPEFMLHDPVSNRNWGKLFDIFSEFQFSLESNGEIIGIANCIPYFWDKPFEELPERGWDWVFEKGVTDNLQGTKPNILNGLQIAVNRDYQGRGVSSMILREMISIAQSYGYKYVTVPVRPSLKSKYPLISIDNYIKWKREDGLPYDPWLRVHIRIGGRIIKPCHEAMYISGTIEDWEEWTDLKFYETDEYIIPGALEPVRIDVNKNIMVKKMYFQMILW